MEDLPHRPVAKTLRDLIVWQKAHRIMLDVYRFTEGFPKREIYGLTSQFRRAAVSISANNAEGFKKRGRSDKARYMNTAQGSLEERHYYLILAKDLEYGDSQEPMAKLDEVGRLLARYHDAILASVR